MRQLRRGALTVLLIVPYIISQEAWAENEAEASTAGNKIVELPAVSVTATRTEREIDLTSKPVTIITREQIEARNARTVVELLADVPGVSFSRAGGLVGQAVVRGFNTNDPRALLLIDGDRFRGRNTLEYTLLDPNQIERIEVIRGPASTLYGPDALAGVINIITRRAQGDATGAFGLKVRLGALNFNSVNDLYGGRAELEGLGNGVDLLLGINGRTANDYESPEGTIPNSDLETLSADLRLGYTPILGHHLELTAKYAEVEAGDAGGISGRPGAPLLSVRRDPIRERFIKLGYTGENPGLGLEQIQASVYARELFTNIPSENRTIPNRLTELENIVDGPLVIGGKLLGTLPWGDNLLTAGIDFFHEDRKGSESSRRVTNFNPDGSVKSVMEFPRSQDGPDSKQTDVGVFVHNDWYPSDRWTLSLGGRADYIRSTTETDPLIDEGLREAFEHGKESTETPLTGGLGLIYRPWESLHFTANINKAFRAPATFESFGASRFGTGFLVPNPDLESEEAITYELGTRLRLPGLNANLTGFFSDYTNLIVRRNVTFQGLPSSQRQNAGEAQVYGIEFDASFAFAQSFKAFLNAAWLRSTDTTLDQPLPYIPPLNGLVGIRYFLPMGFDVEGVSRWSLDKDRIDPAEERETAGYVVFDLYAGIDLWKLSSSMPQMRLSVGLENIFDKTYRLPTTVEDVRFAQSDTNPLLEPGRALTVTLRSRF